jgi:hypothetical protein
MVESFAAKPAPSAADSLLADGLAVRGVVVRFGGLVA